MGCDIHAMLEKKDKYGWWIQKGDPDVGRDYELFAVLANVRNDRNIPFISLPKGEPKECSDEFESWLKSWEGDAHGTSWVTLKEMKEFNINQEFYDNRLILAKNEKGKITETCAATTGKHLGEVGKRKIFGLWGRKTWKELIKEMERISDGNDKEVRLLFFFDN